MLIQICVGSACHLNGAEQLVALFQKAIAENGLEPLVTLAGSFCAGKCNREGVTVTVDDTVYPGVTVAGFESFFKEKVLQPLAAARK